MKERIAYIKGLIEGSERVADTASAKVVWENLLTACDQLSDKIDALEASHEEIVRIVYGIDADLSDLEEEVYGEDYDVDDDDTIYYEDELGDGFDDDELTFIVCSGCGERVFFERADLRDDSVELSCPECGQVIEKTELNGRVPIGDGAGTDL